MVVFWVVVLEGGIVILISLKRAVCKKNSFRKSGLDYESVVSIYSESLTLRIVNRLKKNYIVI